MTNLRAGQQIQAGPYLSTVMPDMDFEAYSEAGLLWNGEKWTPLTGKGGISATGAWAYSEHPTTEVMCLFYDLKDGAGQRAWIPGCQPPQGLLDHIASGGLIEAHNSFFEYSIWTNVCVAKMGWPVLPLEQTRDSAAKARRWGLPGALEKVSKVLGCAPKDMEGNRIMRQLATPRKPTKNKQYMRCTPETDPDKFLRLYKYCGQDVSTESEISEKCPDLTPYELEVWKLDQRINARGVYCDRPLVDAGLSILGQAAHKYNTELHTITGGLVSEATSLPAIKAFCASRGFAVGSLDKEHLPIELKRAADAKATDVHRVLEIRSILGSASVAKLHAMSARMGRDNRIRDLFTYCGAERTSRWSGGGVQPQNMPGGFETQEETERAIELIMTRDLRPVEAEYPDPVEPLVKTLRSALCAAPGHDLIASDYSAIEARVLAVIAGEQWRIDVFKDHGKIYEMSASKITGIPFEEFERHKAETGSHHPMRKKVGKVSELASGYQGSVGAWKAFGADEFMTDDEILTNVKLWRTASPNIVKLWYGLEEAAVNAVLTPGNAFSYRSISYQMKDGVLYCKLPSGRLMAYHHARVRREVNQWGKEVWKLSFWGIPTPPRPQIWSEIETYGGKLCENVVQAASRDLLADAMLRLDRAGYPIVLHVHDEIVAEVLEGWGAIEEFEAIMAERPEWAADWPIKAAGGWRGKRFRKD